MSKAIMIVNDGWGIAPKGSGNYVMQAKTPFFDSLTKTSFHRNMLLKLEHLVVFKTKKSSSIPAYHSVFISYFTFMR